MRLRRTAPRLRKLLVIDDDQKLLASYRDLLAPYGFDVLVADDGSTAVPLVEQNPDISLVILDIRMSRMNGDEWLRWFRQTRTEPPVIIITGYPFDGKDELQPAAVLQKPFEVAELLDLVGLFCGLSANANASFAHSV